MLIINGRILTMTGITYEEGYVKTDGKLIESVGDMEEAPGASDGEMVLDVQGA